MPPHGHHHHGGGWRGRGGGWNRGPVWYPQPVYYDAPVYAEPIITPMIAEAPALPPPSDAVTKTDLKKFLVPAAIGAAIYYFFFR